MFILLLLELGFILLLYDTNILLTLLNTFFTHDFHLKQHDSQYKHIKTTTSIQCLIDNYLKKLILVKQ